MSTIQVLKPVVLDYATVLPFPGGRSGSFVATLTGAATLANVANPIEGAKYTYMFIQDSTGHTLGISNRIRVATGAVPNLSPGPGARDVYEFWVYGGYAHLISTKSDLRLHVAAPTLPTASTGVAGVINVAWTNNEAAVTSYEVYRGDSQFTVPDDIQFFTLVATTTSASYADTDVTPATEYWYAVRAFIGTDPSDVAGTQAAGTAT